MVIELGSLKELVKAYGDAELEWAKNAQERKWTEKAQEGRNGPRKPMSNGMGWESPK